MVKRTRTAAQDLAEGKEQEGKLAADFTVGIEKSPKKVDLRREEKDVMASLGLLTEVTADKDEITEEERRIEEIFVKLDKGEVSINDLSRGEKTQLYLTLRALTDRQIDNDTKKEYFRRIGRKHRSPEAQEKAVYHEKIRILRTVSRIERDLTGREATFRLPDWLGVKGDLEITPLQDLAYGFKYDMSTRRPTPRDLLKVEHKIRDYQAEGLSREAAYRRAAADFASQEIEAVLNERSEEIDQTKITAAEQSFPHKKWGKLAERLPDLVQKGVLERRKIAAWGNAEDLRKFLGVEERDLSDKEIIRMLTENNPNLNFITEDGRVAPNTPRVLLNRIRNRDWDGVERYLNRRNVPQRHKTYANQLVRGLVREHSVDTVMDALIDIIDRKLPEGGVEAAPKLEAGKELVENSNSGNLAVLISEGMADSELRQQGFKKEQIDKVKEKYFYQDETGQYKLKEAVEDDEFEDKEKEQLAEFAVSHPQEAGPVYDRIALEQAGEDFDNRIEADDAFKQEVLDAVNNVCRPFYRNFREFNNLEQVEQHSQEQVRQVLENVRNSKIRELAQEKLNDPGWQEDDQLRQEVGKALVEENPQLAKEFNSSFKYIKAAEVVELGPENIAILKQNGSLAGESLTKAEEAVQAAGQELPDILDETGPRAEFKEDEEVIDQLLEQQDRRRSLLSIAWMVFLGILSMENTLMHLYQQGETEAAADLETLIQAG